MKRSIDTVSKKVLANKKKKIIDSDFQKSIIIRNDTDDFFVRTNLNWRYIKIGKYIYNVRSNDVVGDYDEWEKMDKSIGITLTQYNQISEYITNDIVTVTEFSSDNINVIPKICIKISTNNSVKFSAKKSHLTDFFIDLLLNSIISVKQKFTVNYKDYELNVVVDSIDNMEIGRINEDTIIEFKYSKNIAIYQNLVTIQSEHLDVKILECIDLDTGLRSLGETAKYEVSNNMELKNLIYTVNNGKFPLFIHRKIIDHFVKQKLKFDFVSGSTITFTENDFEFRIVPTVFNSNDGARYPNIYTLNTDNMLNIKSSTQNLIIVDDLQPVKNISFSLSGNNFDSRIIFVDEIKDFIRKNIKTFSINQEFKLKYLSKDISIKVNYASPFIGKNLMYEIDDKTNIKIDFMKNLIVVANHDSIEIKTITIKISRKPIFSIFDLVQDESYNFSEDLLKNITLIKIPNKLTKKYRTSITYDYNSFDLTVADIEYGTKPDSDQDQLMDEPIQTYGHITDNTVFKFVLSKKLKGSTIYKSAIASEIPENSLEELEKHVGGLSNELKLVVKNICLARGSLREEFILRGLKPTKGIILHGPPGTGKTHLASQLGKIIGSNITLMSGSEIFNKYVGQSESNVRKIFKEAKNAWKKFGNKSQTYMVIIDEIDAMLPVRSSDSSNSVRESVVNQFLSEMDGLVQFNNFICIGITNRLELLDPAAIRSGRFDVHVKIDVPDKNGRKKIFEIHTKKLVEINRMENIDVDKIISLTDKFTGADIKNMVDTASINSLERLFEQKCKKEEIKEAEYAIQMSDFIQAINKIKEINIKNDLEKVLTMYN